MREDDEEEFEGFPLLPNGAAYERTETRHGPPLDYVAQKLRSSVEMAHSTYNAIKSFSREDLLRPPAAPRTASSVTYDAMLSSAYAAFAYALIAYLALKNMLAAASTDRLTEKLLQCSGDELRRRLDRIDEEGTVTG